MARNGNEREFRGSFPRRRARSDLGEDAWGPTRFNEGVDQDPYPIEPQPPDRLRWDPIFPQEPNASDSPPYEPAERGVDQRICRIVVFLLLAIATAVGILFRAPIRSFLSTMTAIGSGTPEEQVKGLLAVGLIGVVIVAVVRILTRKD